MKTIRLDLLKEMLLQKDVWKFACLTDGPLCVTMAGIIWMLKLFAGSWVIQVKVRRLL